MCAVSSIVCVTGDVCSVLCVHQVLYTLYRLLRLRETCEELLYSIQIVNDVCDCLKHDNEVVVEVSPSSRDTHQRPGRLFGWGGRGVSEWGPSWCGVAGPSPDPSAVVL